MTSSISGTNVPSSAGASSFDAELLATLFDLGREVTSGLDLDELLAKILAFVQQLDAIFNFHGIRRIAPSWVPDREDRDFTVI